MTEEFDASLTCHGLERRLMVISSPTNLRVAVSGMTKINRGEADYRSEAGRRRRGRQLQRAFGFGETREFRETKKLLRQPRAMTP